MSDFGVDGGQDTLESRALMRSTELSEAFAQEAMVGDAQVHVHNQVEGTIAAISKQCVSAVQWFLDIYNGTKAKDTAECTTDPRSSPSKTPRAKTSSSESATGGCSPTSMAAVGHEFYTIDNSAAIEDKATQILRLVTRCDSKVEYILEDYLCSCEGVCPIYKKIEADVFRLVTWRSVAEQRLIIRLLQAFSTYNETISYREDQIGDAERYLELWCGDEDKAFTSFVVLHDELSFLCAVTDSIL